MPLCSKILPVQLSTVGLCSQQTKFLGNWWLSATLTTILHLLLLNKLPHQMALSKIGPRNQMRIGIECLSSKFQADRLQLGTTLPRKTVSVPNESGLPTCTNGFCQKPSAGNALACSLRSHASAFPLQNNACIN